MSAGLLFGFDECSPFPPVISTPQPPDNQDPIVRKERTYWVSLVYWGLGSVYCWGRDLVCLLEE